MKSAGLQVCRSLVKMFTRQNSSTVSRERAGEQNLAKRSALSLFVRPLPSIVIAVIAQIPQFEGVSVALNTHRVIVSSALRHTTSDLNYFVIIRSHEAASIASPSFCRCQAHRSSKHIGTSSFLSLFTILTWHQSKTQDNTQYHHPSLHCI